MTKPDLQPAVERTALLPAPPAEVWRHLTEGSLMSAWMEGSVRLEPRIGGRIELTRSGLPDVWGTIEEMAPQRRVQWSWRTDDGLPTLVEVSIEPRGAETSIVVRESLLPWTVTGPEVTWSLPELPRPRRLKGVS